MRMRYIAGALALATAGLPGMFLPAQAPPDTLSITAAPGLVSFALKPTGVAKGSFPVVITTTWRIQRGGTSVRVYAYFSNPPAALANSTGGNIPSSRVFGKVNTGSFLPFTGNSPLNSGGSLFIFDQQVKNNKQLTRNDSVDLQIDTTGLQLSPGAYSGAMRIQALAI
jgi:hypothetical protein